ncbi:sulfatase-like hydrolase/transferase [Isosphaeraceae bacterium EP7]
MLIGGGLKRLISGLVIGLGVASGEVHAAKTPNIVLIVADDLGYSDLGFQAGQEIPTPHIDALAAGGVRCSNGYVTGPYCSPTRAGLLTGRYQQRFGHEFNPSGPTSGLPTSEVTIADRLTKAGYATALIGKWHLGGAPKFHPLKRGFGEFYGFLGGAHPYQPGEGAPIFRGEEVVKETEYLTDAIGREAAAFLDRQASGEKPFFLEITFNAVHTPMQATAEREAKFASISNPRRRAYAAMLSAMDDAVGRVMAKLREKGLEENTLVIFFSDNGGPTMGGTTINGSINTPLRGSKRTTLEGGVRVPFVWSWKGVLPAGKVYDKPLVQLDVLPTALALAGVEVSPDWKLDGVDVLPFLKGDREGTPHEVLFWRLGEQTAIRRGDWKLVRYDRNVDARAGEPVTKGARAVVTEAKLYNLSEDIGETLDLSAQRPDLVKSLDAEWKAWSNTLAEPLWGPAGG